MRMQVARWMSIRPCDCLLEHDRKAIHVTNGPHWFQGNASSNVYGVRLACTKSPSGMTLRDVLDVSFPEQILSDSFTRDCIDGAEVGELGAGGELRWAVNPGQLRIAILSYQSDGVRPWLTSATFDVQPGQTYRFVWKTGAALSNRRLLLDGDIVMQGRP